MRVSPLDYDWIGNYYTCTLFILPLSGAIQSTNSPTYPDGSTIQIQETYPLADILEEDAITCQMKFNTKDEFGANGDTTIPEDSTLQALMCR